MLCQTCSTLLNTTRLNFRHFKLFKINFNSGPFNNSFKDYYKILGVPKNASAQEIKAAYYELSKLYHPDVRNSSGEKHLDRDAAKLKFQEINAAYEVLGNKAKRVTYDQSISEQFQRQSHPEHQSFGNDEEDRVFQELRRYEEIRKTYKYRGMDPRANQDFDAYFRFVRKKFADQQKQQDESRKAAKFSEPANPFNFKEYGRPLSQHEYTDFQREMIRNKQAEANVFMGHLIRNLFIFNLIVVLVLVFLV